jgi:hypothetical protein
MNSEMQQQQQMAIDVAWQYFLAAVGLLYCAQLSSLPALCIVHACLLLFESILQPGRNTLDTTSLTHPCLLFCSLLNPAAPSLHPSCPRFWRSSRRCSSTCSSSG